MSSIMSLFFLQKCIPSIAREKIVINNSDVTASKDEPDGGGIPPSSTDPGSYIKDQLHAAHCSHFNLHY
jgi:hypothetical protein